MEQKWADTEAAEARVEDLEHVALLEEPEVDCGEFPVPTVLGTCNPIQNKIQY
jgi:hypothetical protein